MKIYWSYNSIPELADIPKEKRKEVWTTCYHRSKISYRYILVAVVIGAVCISAGMLLGKFYLGRTGGILGTAIAGGIAGFIIGQSIIASVRPYVREYLNSNGKTN